MKRTILLSGLIIGFIIVWAVFFATTVLDQTDRFQKPDEFHSHADFKLYVSGDVYNFSQEQFMARKEKKLSDSVHLHDLNGFVIHKHREGILLSEFFESIGFVFDSECLTVDTGEIYCSANSLNNDVEGRSANKVSLRMFVTGIENFELGKYHFVDLDRILLTYGNEGDSQIQEQMDSVTDEACIFSEKCPERGKAPLELSCVGSVCFTGKK